MKCWSLKSQLATSLKTIKSLSTQIQDITQESLKIQKFSNNELAKMEKLNGLKVKNEEKFNQIENINKDLNEEVEYYKAKYQKLLGLNLEEKVHFLEQKWNNNEENKIKIEKSIEKSIENLQKEWEVRFKNMVLEKDTLIDSLQKEIQAKMLLINSSHDKEISSLENHTQSSLKALENTHETNLKTLIQSHSEIVKSIKQNCDSKMKQSKETCKKAIEVLRKSNLEENKILQKKNQEKIENFEKEIEKLKRKCEIQSKQLNEVRELLDISMVQLDKKEYINKELTEVIKKFSQNQTISNKSAFPEKLAKSSWNNKQCRQKIEALKTKIEEFENLNKVLTNRIGLSDHVLDEKAEELQSK